MCNIDYNALLLNTAGYIGFVADADTYELLYMNDAALRTYEVAGPEGYRGRTCYEVTQGRSSPCENCPLHRIAPGEEYRWEQFSSPVRRWYDSMDHIVQLGGRRLHVKVAQDITARKAKHELVLENLTREDTLFRCLGVLAKEKDIETALRFFLKEIARYYRADRAYIFEFDLKQQTMDNTFEWCAEGVTAERARLQGLPIAYVQDWLESFARTGEMYISSIDREMDHDGDDYRVLAAQQIESVMAAPLRQGDRSVTGFLGVDNPRRQVGDLLLLRSATEFIQAELEKSCLLREMEYLHYTDVLTGAHNRKKYEYYMKQYALDAPECMGAVAVSVNGMKDINARYGAAHGDAILCRVCRAMQEHIPGQVFRSSGDEFIALCEGGKKDRFQAAVSDMRKSLRAQEDCSVSVGCAWQSGEVAAETLVQQAEELMYAEKHNYYGSVLRGGGQYTRRGSAEEVLREIREGRFVVFFQPQVNFERNAIFGAEALVRKLGEDGRLIPPDKFIPFYETMGVIRYVDLHVLELTCAALREWEDKGLDLRMSVNFSRLTLMEPEIVDTIQQICRKHGVSPTRITVEMTENIHRMDQTHLRRLVAQLKEGGFRLSLDDFGSSYANLAILSVIDFDEIKFDRTLIQDLETNVKSQVVMRNGMRMCEELEGSVSVAEGIERRDQMELLHQYGCRVGQGYYFSKPVSKEAFSALLREKWGC